MLVPAAATTVTFTVPKPAGEVAMIWVVLITVNEAGAVPNLTAVTPVKPLPLIVTAEPPAIGCRSG